MALVKLLRFLILITMYTCLLINFLGFLLMPHWVFFISGGVCCIALWFWHTVEIKEVE